MKPSFYIVAWILVSVLIEFLNIQFLQKDTIIASFIIVGITYLLLNKLLFVKFVQNQEIRDGIKTYEIFYNNNITKLRREYFGVFYIDIAAFSILTLGGIYSICCNSVDLWGYAIGGVFYILFGVSVYDNLKAYISLRKLNSLSGHEEEILGKNCIEGYNKYCEDRSSYTFKEMLPAKGLGEKVYDIISALIALICIIFGIILIIASLADIYYARDNELMLVAAIILGSIECFAGIKDLIESFKNW